MKKLIVILAFFALLFSFSDPCFSLDVSGTWTGYSNEIDCEMISGDTFTIEISQDGNTVTITVAEEESFGMTGTLNNNVLTIEPFTVCEEDETETITDFTVIFSEDGNYASFSELWTLEEDGQICHGATTGILVKNTTPLICTGDIHLVSLCTEMQAVPQIGQKVRFIARALGAGPIYYKFWFRGGYGTPSYDPYTGWMVMRDWDLDNTAEFTFTSVDHYIVVVWAVQDPNNIPEDYPIIGMNVKVVE